MIAWWVSQWLCLMSCSCTSHNWRHGRWMSFKLGNTQDYQPFAMWVFKHVIIFPYLPHHEIAINTHMLLCLEEILHQNFTLGENRGMLPALLWVKPCTVAAHIQTICRIISQLVGIWRLAHFFWARLEGCLIWKSFEILTHVYNTLYVSMYILKNKYKGMYR